MLEFNEQGLLIPNTVIASSIDELRHHFVEKIPTITRTENFEKYLRYSTELKRLLNEKSIRQWVNGSFVTKLQNPNDIDILTFINYELVAELKIALDSFGVKGAWKIFGVDAYILEVYPETHPNYFFYKSDLAYWMDKFGKTKRDMGGKRNRKGFLEIIY